ncbi:MAG: ATP-binding protein [Nitrososphaerota archaeon]
MGFSNPARALFTAVREFIENSLDATEPAGILPEIYVRLSAAKRWKEGTYNLLVKDNGIGIPFEYVPFAFC